MPLRKARLHIVITDPRILRKTSFYALLPSSELVKSLPVTTPINQRSQHPLFILEKLLRAIKLGLQDKVNTEHDEGRKEATYNTTVIEDHLIVTCKEGTIDSEGKKRTILSASIIVCNRCAMVMTVTSLPS